MTEKSDCISGNVGGVAVSYSMVETQSNENVQMSGSECRRAKNTLFPTSDAVEKTSSDSADFRWLEAG